MSRPDLARVILHQGSAFVDDRGTFAHCPSVNLSVIRRFYVVSNYSAGRVRAWHGHRSERKFVLALSGASLVAAVRIDDWTTPSRDLVVERFVLTAGRPEVLEIPAGFANGWMSLTDGATLLFLSTLTIEESRADDIRYDSRYWNPWSIEDR